MDIVNSGFWIGSLLAIFCGAVVGLERQLKGKPVGIRTSIFICLGTDLFISLGLAHTGANVDATRVLGQVIPGIGFLGAGIILSQEGRILGITSASAFLKTEWRFSGEEFTRRNSSDMLLAFFMVPESATDLCLSRREGMC